MSNDAEGGGPKGTTAADWCDRIIPALTEWERTRIARAAAKVGLAPEIFVLRAIRRAFRESELEDLVEMTMSVAALEGD